MAATERVTKERTATFIASPDKVIELIERKRKEELDAILRMRPQGELKMRAEIAFQKFSDHVTELTNPHTKEEMRQLEKEAARELLELRAIKEVLEKAAVEKEAARQAAREAQLKADLAAQIRKAELKESEEWREPGLPKKWAEGGLEFESKDSRTVSSVMNRAAKWRVLFNEDGTATVRTGKGEMILRGNEEISHTSIITKDDALRARDKALEDLKRIGKEPAGSS